MTPSTYPAGGTASKTAPPAGYVCAALRFPRWISGEPLTTH